jgi:hypothetical protein
VRQLETIMALVSGKTLLKEVWPNEADRPSERWLKYQKQKRTIPFVKLGRRTWFDPEVVAEAIKARFTIQSHGAR